MTTTNNKELPARGTDLAGLDVVFDTGGTGFVPYTLLADSEGNTPQYRLGAEGVSLQVVASHGYAIAGGVLDYTTSNVYGTSEQVGDAHALSFSFQHQGEDHFIGHICLQVVDEEGVVPDDLTFYVLKVNTGDPAPSVSSDGDPFALTVSDYFSGLVMYSLKLRADETISLGGDGQVLYGIGPDFLPSIINQGTYDYYGFFCSGSGFTAPSSPSKIGFGVFMITH